MDFDSVYSVERMPEVEALCHPRLRAKIAAEKIILCSFAAAA